MLKKNTNPLQNHSLKVDSLLHFLNNDVNRDLYRTMCKEVLQRKSRIGFQGLFIVNLPLMPKLLYHAFHLSVIQPNPPRLR